MVNRPSEVQLSITRAAGSLSCVSSNGLHTEPPGPPAQSASCLS